MPKRVRRKLKRPARLLVAGPEHARSLTRITPPSHWRRVPVTAALVGGLLLPILPASDKKRHKPASAVESVMDRQIRNAIDAGDGDLLIRALRAKVVTEPANVGARLALAAAYEHAGAPELAIDHYRIAATLYESEAAASRLARTLDGLGESEQAIAVLVQFCGSHPGASSGMLSELGILEDEMSDLKAGEFHHKRALAAALIENAPNQDALHNNLGYNLVLQKRFDEAETQLRAALELNSRSEIARNNLAYALAAGPNAGAGRRTEALLQWQSLSGPAAAHNNLAGVYLEQNRYQDARHEIALALEFDHFNAAALKNLEWVSAMDGQPAQAAAAVVAGATPPPASAKIGFWKRLFVRKHKDDAQTAAAQVAAMARKNHRNQN